MPPPGHEVQAEWPGSLEANRSVWSKTVLAGVRSDVEDSSCPGMMPGNQTDPMSATRDSELADEAGQNLPASRELRRGRRTGDHCSGGTPRAEPTLFSVPGGRGLRGRAKPARRATSRAS